MARIFYPPDIEFESDLTQTARWPRDNFSWLGGLMRESKARMPISLEILQYHAYVLGEALLEHHMTRNIAVIEAILSFLASEIGLTLRGKRWLLELCSGTGVITTPLARYFNIVAVEINRQYIDSFKTYLDNTKINRTKEIRNRIRICQGDIGSKDLESKIEKIVQRPFEAVILNPHFGLIPEALGIARKFTSQVIIVVMPLDIIEETGGAYTWRDQETVGKDVGYVRDFRKEWKLVAVHPFIREDGTSQVGTFLFRLEPRNR